MITLQTVQNLVLQKARLLGPTGNIVNNAITIPQLNNLILEALQRVTEATKTPQIWAKLTWPVTNPATQEVTLPPDCLTLLRVYVNGKMITPSTLHDLNQERELIFDAEWQVFSPDSVNTPLALGDFVAQSNLNGVEFKYYFRSQQPKLIGLVPALNTSQLIVIDYIQTPAIPTSISTALNYPDECQRAIVEETLWRLEKQLRRYQDCEVSMGVADKEIASAAKNISSFQSQRIENLQPYPYNTHFSF